MKMTSVLLTLLLVIAPAAAGSEVPGIAGADPVPIRYEIIDLGTFGSPGSATLSNATGINELGQVAGVAEDDNGVNHAFIYRDGELVDLGFLTPGIDGSLGKGINDLGDVVGSSWAPLPGGSGTYNIPILWTEEDGMISLSDGSQQAGWAWGVNNHGQVALSLLNKCYFWDPAEGHREIKFDDTPAGHGAEAWEINDEGVVTGMARGADNNLHAYRYFSATDTIVDLHDAGIYRHTIGYGINELGDVAGWAETPDYYVYPMLWTTEGQTIQFPEGDLRPDLLTGKAEHVNNLGDVVGHDDSAEYGWYNEAWVAFDAKNGPVNKQLLEDLISPEDRAEWEIVYAFEINDNRQICGIGVHNGLTRGFLMNPLTKLTVGAALTCQPSSGTVPFPVSFGVVLESRGKLRPATVVAARIDVLLADGTPISNWKAGTRTLWPGQPWSAGWSQVIPALDSVLGDNVFTLAVEDITPSPYNQPPYPPSGDTVTDSCTVTALGP